jgi:16S rRNA (guanine966-N2)-methyltransferase
MRIIAGEHRGRKILPPPGEVTRPITDRVKQSLFDILSPQIEGAKVYDIFAGTGSMGLECLSRGAAHATFFEADRGALSALKKNIETLKVTDCSRVIPGDLFRWFERLPVEKNSIDLAFLDPPYRYLNEQPAALVQLAANLAEHVKADGIVVFRHDAKDELSLPALPPFDRREYGSMILEFLKKRR